MLNMLLPILLTLAIVALVVWRLLLGGPGLRRRLGLAALAFGNDLGYFIADRIDPPELVGYVRERAVLRPPTLETVLPKRNVNDIEYELRNFDSPFVNIARYRGWDTPTVLGKRPGVATVKGEIMPLGLSMTKNEKEVLRMAQLEQATQGLGVEELFNDALNCGLACESRIEIARGDILTDGVVTINESGAIVSADFAVPGTHLVAAAIAWTDTTNAVPVDNLLAYEATYRADNGGLNPDGWLMSSDVVANLMRNAQVKSLANEGGGAPGIVGADRVGDVLRVAGVRAPIVVFDGQVPDATGAATRTLNARHIIAVRAGMGEVLVGPHPVAQLAVLAGRIQTSIAPGLFTWVEEETGPVRVTTTTEAVALPVLRDPKALFRAIV